MGGTWRVETGDGSVTLNVPADLAADVEAHTGDGHISFDLPVTLSDTKGDHDRPRSHEWRWTRVSSVTHGRRFDSRLGNRSTASARLRCRMLQT